MPESMRRAARLVRLADLFDHAEALVPATTVDLPTAIVHSNAARVGFGDFIAQALQDVFHPRRARLAPILIGRLPSDIALMGGNCYWLAHGDDLVAEQINPLTRDPAADLQTLRSLHLGTEEISEPVILVARFGDVTWGHWAAEILPRAVMAERAFPGRFRFLVPDFPRPAAGRRTYADAIDESLVAYGIAADRLIRLRGDREYRFTQLYGISDLWSAAMPNPRMLAAMRDLALPPPAADAPRRIALFRRDAATRNLRNIDEVAPVLQDHGFTPVEMAALSYTAQAAAFRDAEQVFGVLGSGFTGLMFSPPDVRVVGASPGAWQDAYYYTFLQWRDASYADLRGGLAWRGDGIARDMPFELPPEDVASALGAVARPAAAHAREGFITVAGKALPHRLGTPVWELDFGIGGNAAPHLREGWGAAEPNHTWSLGRASRIVLPAPRGPGIYVLDLRLFTLLAEPYVVARRLDVLVNNEPVGGFDIHRATNLFCRLPDLGAAGEIDILLLHPFCFSARQLNIVDDDRPIAFGFQSLTLWRLPD